ncbi:hypothetical protein F4680DRAFT_453860 [Xylaria scruposa]|nr:hypothetical protein F4680DRAFT_453860 [Xylaria scruposa]
MNNQDLFDDYDDIVATQGAYLIPRPRTPVLQETCRDDFATTLKMGLEAAIKQGGRTTKFPDLADEWRQGYTPPEVEEKHDTTTDDGSNNDGDDDSKDKDKDKCGNDMDARVSPGKLVAAQDQPRRQHWLFSLLADPVCSIATPHGRKRREISGKEEEEEKERPAKRMQS